MPLGSTALTVAVSAFGSAAPFFGKRIARFNQGEQIRATSTGAANLYGVNHPGRLDTTRVFRFRGDGTTTAFTLPTAATGVTYPTTNAAALTVANYLEAIAMTLPGDLGGKEINATTLIRKGSDVVQGSLGATGWGINGTTVTVGVAPAAGVILEVIIPLPSTITQITGGAFTANREYVVTCYDFLTASVATVDLFVLGRT